MAEVDQVPAVSRGSFSIYESTCDMTNPFKEKLRQVDGSARTAKCAYVDNPHTPAFTTNTLCVATDLFVSRRAAPTKTPPATT